LIKITDYTAPHFQDFSSIILFSPLSVLFTKAFNLRYSINLKPSFGSNLDEKRKHIFQSSEFEISEQRAKFLK